MEMTGAEAILACLKAEQVPVVFGYPGGAVLGLYDAIYKTHFPHILTGHEQGAIHAADGYARATGKVGVCIATSGPGVCNMVTGIATANMDSIPLVIISGQVATSLIGQDAFQEADTAGITTPITKYNYLVRKVENLPQVLKEAFYIARTGRPGPVLIDVPVDIQQNLVESFSYPEKAEIIGYKPRTQGHGLQIKKAIQAIEEAKRPLICCGGGVVLAGAREEMKAFAQNSGLPIVATMMGIGVVPMDSDRYLGMIGSHGRSYANRAMHEADLIILCGARVGDRAVAAPEQVAEQAKIIHIDIDPAEIGKNMPVDIPIVGDIQQVLAQMAEKVHYIDRPEWVKRVVDLKKDYVPHGTDREDAVEPRSFIRSLSQLMDENAILVADVGQNQIWCARNYNVKEGRFLTSGGLGTMGYALPAAIGAKLAKPHREVVAVCGDGSFQMVMGELGTLCQTGVDIKLIIMENGRLGMVKELQDKLYGHRYAATTLDGNPDFVALCAAYGLPAKRAESNRQAVEIAKEMLEHKGPFVLVCRVDPDTPTI